jgi:hypothetical protein
MLISAVSLKGARHTRPLEALTSTILTSSHRIISQVVQDHRQHFGADLISRMWIWEDSTMPETQCEGPNRTILSVHQDTIIKFWNRPAQVNHRLHNAGTTLELL